MLEKTLWDYFNLAENNQDQGGGILYCLKYNSGRIKAHQESVVAAIKTMGIELEGVGEEIAAKSSRALNKEEKNRCYPLFEELSCLNEALEYVDAGIGEYNSVGDLIVGLKSKYGVFLINKKLRDAYNLVAMEIPQFVEDLRIADKQNKILSSSEREGLEDLMSFAKEKEAFLNNPKGHIIFNFN